MPLSQDGFAAIAAQGAGRLGVFARRVVEHLGGMVVSTTELEAFAAQYVTEPWENGLDLVVGQPGFQPCTISIQVLNVYGIVFGSSANSIQIITSLQQTRTHIFCLWTLWNNDGWRQR